MPIGPIVWLPAEHLNQLESLLRSNGLPVQDVAEQADIFCAIFDGDKLVAAGGLEAAGDDCLLRSVAVESSYRGQGLARAITEFLLQQAQSMGRPAVYLLTETAAQYFENLGFHQVSRAQVPATIARTRQFSSLCPDSASCLMTDLPRN
jgi:N-acetylglutamate synthase-like GNAT family acetyltransferase